ncbi:TetR/AcrR family transcriptional regulator [Devosia sp. PTR5]|uniref:TetR/AcrR family transcriptional regulator n=1 Tax=Devosia oryzisoli TaxID=2774138 RepID=A0A927ITV9_9HYPH|nr:TetR/AcrR family transcriptional regulator [Devosia oryzisoli]MBD8066228.1 TetR/AcrR family transcriptional regulator [Devosia oryzisoli]
MRQRQDERRDATRRQLITAARRLFATKGFAATGTPELVAAAGLSRGALYHHYADKTALFAAVVEAEHVLVDLAVEAAVDPGDDDPGPVRQLVLLADARVAALSDPARQRMLLIDAPAALDPATMLAIRLRHGRRLFEERIDAALAAGAIRAMPADPLADLLDSLVERAALAPVDQQPRYRKTIKALIRGLKT